MPNKVENQALWGRLLQPLVIALGVGVCATCALAGWQRAAPLSAPALFPFSETWYARAMAAATPAEGIADTQKAIKLAPANAQNWMLLAYQYNRADRTLSPRVIEAIRQSYTVSPLDLDVSAYRLSFIFHAWSALPRDIHDDAVNEAQQFGQMGRGVLFLNANVPTITDERARLQFAVITLIARHQFDLMIQKYQKNH